MAMRNGSTLKLTLSDHLGSMAVVTDLEGVRTGEVRYMPWGSDRYTYGTTPTSYRYTGQRQESYINLYWYNSRWYDPALGRFVQPDTIIPQSQGVQGNDRYAYTNNNPLKFTDSTGHSVDCALGEENCEAGEYVEEEIDDPVDNNDDTVALLNKLATASQDIATLIDLGFAIPEVVILAIGLSGGPETIPLVISTFDIIYNASGGNLAETFFSGASLVLTAAADYLDDHQIGDATMTSAITFGAGLMVPDPIGDLVIDSYASGYIHGIFSGFTDIMNGP